MITNSRITFFTITVLLCLLFLVIFPPFLMADEALEPPVPVRTVSPRYPTSLKQEGIPGVVTISCTIDEKGNVVTPTITKTTNEAFSSPALEAISKWKFKPAKRGGVAVPIKITIPIQFTVTD